MIIMQIKRIYSENNDFQHIDVLKRNREKRNKYGEFFVEGVKSIERAIENQWDIVSFAYSSQRKLSNWAKDILQNTKASIHYDMPLDLLEKLSDKEESSELVAVAKMPKNDLSRVKVDENLLVVVFDRPSSYGNLGTIIRSCDSLKVNGLIMTGHCIDPYDPQTIRSSMGSIFALPVIRCEQAELLRWLDEIKSLYHGAQFIGTSAKASRIISDENFLKPTVLFLGNETDGLNRAYKNLCDDLATIPIYGSATSLNVACAASICLYEIDRQRRQS